MKIVHVAAEITPLAKVGGLGDVVSGLTSSLSKNNDIKVFIPKYKSLKVSFLKNLKIKNKKFEIFSKNKLHKNIIYEGSLNNTKIFLIDDKTYLNTHKIYGYKNDTVRFLYFCKVFLEYIYKKNEVIDVLHIHDWHTSIIAPLYKEIYKLKKPLIKKIVLSIHNLQYQGLCKPNDIKNIGFDGKYFLKGKKLQDPNKKRTLNLLKGGINYSDFIVPVSKTYAKEIFLKKNSYGLEKTLNQNKKKIKGIINGIDQNFWDPKTDNFIKYNYLKNLNFKSFLKTKSSNKKYLLDKLNLNQKKGPLICSIGRLSSQKGPFLILDMLKTTLKMDGQFILLGSFCEKRFEKPFKTLKNKLKKDKNVSFNFGFDEKLSHEIFAASDFIIIPSLFEPCGLTQMIAFKYGVIPIVRKTGGLADSVFDLEETKISKSKRNGFSFDKFKSKDACKAIKRAIKFYNEKTDIFYKLIYKNLKLDFSWDKSAKEYLKVYKKKSLK